jgi:CRISPR/Cas system-associated endonuclease/helicase Cas3
MDKNTFDKLMAQQCREQLDAKMQKPFVLSRPRRHGKFEANLAAFVREQVEKIRAADPRPYGPATVIVLNASTYSRLSALINDAQQGVFGVSIRHYVTERVKIAGVSMPLRDGTILAVHERYMAEMTEDESWNKFERRATLCDQFMAGEITLDEWLEKARNIEE